MKKTLQNLATAFVGESQARNRYTMYAKIAKKEGYEKIAALFALTAEQEKEHAKWLFTLIQDLKNDTKVVNLEVSIPTTIGTTIENLKAAIEGENYEHTSMYPEFADIADEEGLPEIATRLRAIANAENNHENRYQQVLKELENETIFASNDEETKWVCRECGYVHKGKTPPEICPSCSHPKAYYEKLVK